jgi:hypothetical protein
MKQTDREKVIVMQGYVQGEELVKRFMAGCYDVKVEVITGGKELIRYDLFLIISKETRFNFYKKKLNKKIIKIWKYIKGGG